MAEAEPVALDDFRQAHWYYTGRTKKVRVVVMHATQSPERTGAARAIASYFATNLDPARKGSAHITVDNTETIGSVRHQDTAFGAGGANSDGYHIEQVGYSEQDESEWADDYSKGVVVRAADAARAACEFFDLPKVWLSADDLLAGAAGITDHNTCSAAFGGTHWDPGPNWPRAEFMALVRQDPPAGPVPVPTPGDDDMPTSPSNSWDQSGRYWVAVQGVDNACWIKTWTASGGWSDWSSIGGTLTAGPTISAGPGGRVDVVCRGINGHVYHNWRPAAGDWVGWEDIGGLVA